MHTSTWATTTKTWWRWSRSRRRSNQGAATSRIYLVSTPVLDAWRQKTGKISGWSKPTEIVVEIWNRSCFYYGHMCMWRVEQEDREVWLNEWLLRHWRFETDKESSSFVCLFVRSSSFLCSSLLCLYFYVDSSIPQEWLGWGFFQSMCACVRRWYEYFFPDCTFVYIYLSLSLSSCFWLRLGNQEHGGSMRDVWRICRPALRKRWCLSLLDVWHERAQP